MINDDFYQERLAGRGLTEEDRYAVLWAKDESTLSKEVGAFLTHGWELHGPLIVETREEGNRYIQVLTR